MLARYVQDIILFIFIRYTYLVGGIPTPLNNMKVNWDDDIPHIWKNKIHVPVHQPVYQSPACAVYHHSISGWQVPNFPPPVIPSNVAAS